MFLKIAGPLVLLRQRRGVWNVTALSKLHDFSLPMTVLDNSKCSVGEVQAALRQPVHAASPANHVHKASLVPVGIRNAERIDKPMLEGREALAKRLVEAVVQL